MKAAVLWFLIFLFFILAVVGTLIFIMYTEKLENKWIWWGFGISAYAIMCGILIFALQSSDEEASVHRDPPSPVENTITSCKSDIMLMLFLILVAIWSCDVKLGHIRTSLQSKPATQAKKF